MDYNSKPFPVMTIDGLHYIKSVIVSDNPYELTLLCDTSWEGEVFEVPATVEHEGRDYTVEILSLMDEDEKHLISQFKENQERIMNMSVSDDEDLPF